MKNNLQFDQVQPLLASARQTSIVLAQKTSVDRVAAGLALYLALKKTRQAADQVTIFCGRPMTVEFSSLVGVDQIKTQWQNKNLVISFDYTEGSIEKVSYNIENKKFNLLIQPKKGFPPLATENLQYHYSGQQPDLIFAIGGRNLADLGEIYFQHKQVFAKTALVNLDNSSQNQNFGKINLVDAQASSFSELVALMIDHLKLEIDSDISANLLVGLQAATNNFSLDKAGPLSFEAAAFCLRHSVRGQKAKPTLKPMPAKVSAENQPEKPPQDWLEPKVYKGNTLI